MTQFARLGAPGARQDRSNLAANTMLAFVEEALKRDMIPGLLKLKVVRKPATKAKQGINPFTKEEMVIKAKPAKNVVKITALKGLKDLV